MNCDHVTARVVNCGEFDRDMKWCDVCGALYNPYTCKWGIPVISAARHCPDAAAMVQQFHETYNCPIGSLGPILPDSGLRRMRMAILKEEFEEYLEAEDVDSIVEIADALADIVYIAYGTAITYGIDLDDVLTEVHRSNMSKLGVDGKPIRREDGKVLKGPNYFKPDIKKVLGL